MLNEYEIEKYMNEAENSLKVLDGEFKEGKNVMVSIDGEQVTRKVWYHKNAGELAITYDNKNWLSSEFEMEA